MGQWGNEAMRRKDLHCPTASLPHFISAPLSFLVAKYLDSVPFSGIIRIRDMMYAVERPFRLDQGDVSFEAPGSLKEALVRAVAENRTHYVQTTGTPPLVDRLAEKLRAKNHLPLGGPEEVMVT